MEVPISIQLPFLRRIFLDACGYQSTLRERQEHSLAIKVAQAVKSIRRVRLGLSDRTHKEEALMAPHRDGAICPCANQPWLLWHPFDLQYAQPLAHLVPTQDLERYDERIREEVAVYTCVEDLDRAIVGRRRK